MNIKQCSVEGCSDALYTTKFCQNHYQADKRERLKVNSRNYRKRHLDKCRAASNARYWKMKEENPEQLYKWNRKATANYRKTHPERNKEIQKNYRRQHVDTVNAKTARRRAKKQNAQPSWLTNTHKDIIKLFYNAAKAYNAHVDHIVPLQGESVCGLHVPWNLQILSKVDNKIKHNKLTAEGEQLAWTPVSLKL